MKSQKINANQITINEVFENILTLQFWGKKAPVIYHRDELPFYILNLNI